MVQLLLLLLLLLDGERSQPCRASAENSVWIAACSI